MANFISDDRDANMIHVIYHRPLRWTRHATKRSTWEIKVYLNIKKNKLNINVNYEYHRSKKDRWEQSGQRTSLGTSLLDSTVDDETIRKQKER